MKTSPSPAARRRGERGAALVTALLMTTLLLAAGGALILTSSMAVTTAADSTAEMQAYYAAEAGLEASLAVMRRNVVSNTSPATEPTFRNIVCGAATTCNNTGGDFSQWLSYTGGVVSLGSNLSYSLSVRDARVESGAALPASPYSPRFLVITSTGRGPKGARKVLEMTVDRFLFSYDAPATLVLRESQDDTNHVSISPGPGAPNTYSGTDFANPTTTKPAVGVGQTLYNGNTDLAIANTAMAGEVMTGGVSAVGTAGSPWPSIVTDATTASASVATMRTSATSTACPGNNQALSGFTFIDGDCTLGPQNSGSGFLVITGTLTTSGNFNFSGLIFALGSGRIDRGGGGGGIIQGGILAANFDDDDLAAGFGPVVFSTSGGGNSTIRYNSQSIEDALGAFGPRVTGIVEK
jgi:hypothetical protein